jgi:hypothetical protein
MPGKEKEAAEKVPVLKGPAGNFIVRSHIYRLLTAAP